MPEPELVTVVVPCYNPAPYLRETLASIAAQTHPRIETILVNDGTQRPESLALLKEAAVREGASTVVFHGADSGGGDGVPPDTHFARAIPLEKAMEPSTLLAYEMNYLPLTHLHGAPLRLRVENQLGFKMVKWIQAIEFVEDIQSINQGEGGYAEDHEYFGELANI